MLLSMVGSVKTPLKDFVWAVGFDMSFFKMWSESIVPVSPVILIANLRVELLSNWVLLELLPD
jgi:hypothetical protein